MDGIFFRANGSDSISPSVEYYALYKKEKLEARILKLKLIIWILLCLKLWKPIPLFTTLTTPSRADGTGAKDKETLEAQEKLKKKERAHDVMDKRLEMAEALSTRTVNELSEKEKIIQEQAKLIEEKEK